MKPVGEPPQVEDLTWRDHGRQRFEAAYAPEDSVYEQLMRDARLGSQARVDRHDAIVVYASQRAGTDLDLDRGLEAAGIDHLFKTPK